MSLLPVRRGLLVPTEILGLIHSFSLIYNLATGSTPRPRDTQLYTRETEDLGVEGGLGTTGFEEWWTEYLGKKQGSSS